MNQRSRAVMTEVSARLERIIDPLMESIDDLNDELLRKEYRILFTIGPVTEVKLSPMATHPIAAAPARVSYRRRTMANNALTMSDIQSSALTIEVVDARGNPTTLPDGVVPAWTVSDPNIGALTVDATGLTATVSAVGPLGNFTVNVVAQLDAATQAAGALDVTVISSAASAINVVAATPTP